METLKTYNFQDTTATRKIFSLKKRIRAVAGGTSASKTISILVWIIDYCQRHHSRHKLASIVSESHPHLEKGAILDFQNIMKDRGYWKEERWNQTKHTYSFETGNKLEFYSVDTYGKAHGPRRDVLFINEANNLDYKIVDQLIVRTREIVWMDWNPSEEFWFYTEMQPSRDDIDFITLTYKDNEALDEITIAEIESHKNNKAWWTVYGLGQIGEIETRIYKGWQIIDEIPFEARLERFWLDFGYSNHPTSIGAVYYYNGGYILDEITYQKGLKNPQIASILKNQETQSLTIADSAEPKSIDEIKDENVLIIPAEKGADSINNGIQVVQNQKISITKRSVNTIKEYRNYLWETDTNGTILNIPVDLWNHCFAPETLIYTTKGPKRIDSLVGKQGYLYSRDGRIERYFNVRPTRKNTEVVTLEFGDQKITVTPDHLLLQPNGEWKESQLFNVGDMIQSDMYGTAFQWKDILSLFWGNISKLWRKKITSSTMGILFRSDSQRYAYSPQGQKSFEQFYREFEDGISERAYSNTSSGISQESGSNEKKKNSLRYHSTSYKEVAWIKRGEDMAQTSWQEDVESKRTYFQRVCSLPQDIYYQTIWRLRKILSSELQNESTTKKITRITRGFCPITYNLEVENTHSLLVNGIIAHNSMDGIRYAITSLVKDGIPTKAVVYYPSKTIPSGPFTTPTKPNTPQQAFVYKPKIK